MQLCSWTEESSDLGAAFPTYLFQVCLPTAFQLLLPHTVSIGLECGTSPELTYKYPARASAEWRATHLSFYHALFIFPRSPVHQMESCQPARGVKLASPHIVPCIFLLASQPPGWPPPLTPREISVATIFIVMSPVLWVSLPH